MKVNDKAYVVINSAQMKRTLLAFGHEETIAKKILIIGGGNIGFNLAKNIETTFNAISCDGDTSTNDMVSIFSTAKVKNSIIKNINDPKIKDFDNCLHSVLLNLAKRS